MNELTLRLLRPVHGGYCLAHQDGQTYMVRFGLPGEQVKAVPVAKKGKVIFAEVDAVLESSPHRCEPIWVSAGPGGVGGADLCHVKLSYQRAWKAEVLADCLRRLGGEEVFAQAVAANGGELSCQGVSGGSVGAGTQDSDSVAGAAGGERVDNASGENEASGEDGLRYRLRADFEVSAAGRVAMTKFRGEELIEIDSFPLADSVISDSSLFRNPALWSKVFMPSGRIRAWASARGLRVWNGHTLFDEDGCALKEKNIRLTVSGFGEYQLAPDGFWQAHREAARVLCEQVIAAASSDCEPGSAALSAPGEGIGNAVSGERAGTTLESRSAAANENSERLLTPGNRQWKEILELYSGAGLFSRPLAKILDRGGQLSTLEGSKPAVKMARKNLSGAPGRLQIRAGRVDVKALADYGDKIKTPPLVVMDPPRSGAGQKVMAALARLQPERIIYVACDPAALARDLKVAVSHGYQITSLQSYDLFPHTHHVESVVLLTKVHK